VVLRGEIITCESQWDQGSCIYFESAEKPQNFQEFKPQSRRSRRKKKEKDALPINLFDFFDLAVHVSSKLG
jgi:hypothetical protein